MAPVRARAADPPPRRPARGLPSGDGLLEHPGLSVAVHLLGRPRPPSRRPDVRSAVRRIPQPGARSLAQPTEPNSRTRSHPGGLMATDAEKQAYIDDMARKRGYVLDYHKVMAEHDYDVLMAANGLVENAYLKPRTLDRRTKALLF